MVKNSGNAAWIQCIYVSLIAIIIYLLTTALYKKAGNMNILEVAQKAGGRPLKIIVGVLLSVVLLTNSSITTRTLPELIKSTLLPLAPMRFLLILLGISIAIAAYTGIYSIARIHALFIPATAIVFVGMLVFLLPSIESNNIFPILGTGTYNIFVKGLDSLSIFSDTILLFVLIPFTRSYDDSKRAGLWGIITGAIVSTLIVFFYNLSYSYPASEEYILPVYQLTRLIKVGDFFGRLEAFFAFVWSISMMLYSALYLFVICYIWKETFNLKYYKQLVFPFIVIFIASSYLPSSTPDLTTAATNISLFTIPVCLGLPIIIALALRVKLKRQNKNQKL